MIQAEEDTSESHYQVTTGENKGAPLFGAVLFRPCGSMKLLFYRL
jgi:hypothetical protein